MANNHYAPQFYLRNFAFDPERKKVTAVKKEGAKAIWKSRSIRSIGSSEDLYTLELPNGSVSLERVIEREVETPLSRTTTWQKICAGDAHLLDISDKPVLFALMRHLTVRTPHYRKTMKELSDLSEDRTFIMSGDERDYFQSLKAAPETREEIFIENAASLDWLMDDYRFANISIFRTKVRLKTATNPVYFVKIDGHPSLYLPLPGIIPHMNVLPLTPYAMAVLIMGNFENGFENVEIEDDAARGFNRQRISQFAYFPMIDHLICDRSDLVSEMTWAQYSVDNEVSNKVVFSRDG